jgi:hypothetical protein
VPDEEDSHIDKGSKTVEIASDDSKMCTTSWPQWRTVTEEKKAEVEELCKMVGNQKWISKRGDGIDQALDHHPVAEGSGAKQVWVRIRWRCHSNDQPLSAGWCGPKEQTLNMMLRHGLRSWWQHDTAQQR